MVAPVEVAGTVYHRVVGGLLPDSAAATGMASELVQGGVSDWVIRRSGWVVELGVWDSPDEAERQRAEARAEGIPAYVSRFQQADGSVGYAVYAGAYSGEAEAEYLLDRARETGVEAHVVPRVVRPSS
jgi:cell division septation protein DedD